MADLGSSALGILGSFGIGGTVGRAVVALELETKKYLAEMKAAEGQTVASTNAMGKSATGLSSVWKTAFLGIGVAVAAGIAVSIKAASDLNEQINKTKEVFEDNADTVLRWSETTAKGMGISETAALKAAGSFGQILDAAGLAESATSEMSMSLVGLAADLSSFNNIEPDVVLEKLQSGLAGMARPLREVGVFISAARVETEAYTSGIAKQGEELTDAQKIQARYNIILQDTTKAQGDFQRTLGESLPNQMRVLKAELEDTAAALGTALLPVTLEFAKTVLDLVNQLAPLLDLIGKLGPAVHFLGEAFQFMTSPLIKVVGVIQSGIEPTSEMVEVIGEAALNLQSMKAKAEIAAAATSDLTDATKAAGKATNKTTVEFADMTLTLDTVANSTHVTRGAFVNATDTMERRAHQLANAMQEIAREDWVNPKFVAFLSEEGPQWLIGFANLTEEQQHRAQQAWRDSTRELDNAKDSQDKILEGLTKLDGGTSKHTVIIDYRYEGFDPTKPGMSTSAQQR